MSGHAVLERSWRLVGGLGRAAVDHPDRRGLLTCHISRRDGHDEISRPPEGVESDLGQGVVDGECRRGVRDVDIGALRTDQSGGQAHAVEHQVRTVTQQPAVLHRGGFALLAVGHHHLLVPSQMRGAHRAELDAEQGRRRRRGPAEPELVRLALQQRLDVVQQPIPAGHQVGAVCSTAAGKRSNRGVMPGAVATVSAVPACAVALIGHLFWFGLSPRHG